MTRLLTFLTALIFALSTVGLVFPYGFPLVTPLIAATFLLGSLDLIGTDRCLRLDYEVTIVYLALVVFLFVGTGFSPTLYSNVRGDIVNAAAGGLMLPVLFRLVAKAQLAELRDAFATLLFLLMLPVALICLYKFWLLLQGAQLSIVQSPEGRYPGGSSLQTDYNMAALGLAIGAASGVWLVAKSKNAWANWLIIAGVLIMAFAAILTGSRRFFVVGGIVAAVLSAVALGRIVGTSVRFFATWRFRPLAATHTLIATLLIIALMSSAGGSVSQWQSIDISNQFDRLALRASTLINFLGTLESSRGDLLERSLEFTQSFTAADFAIGRGFEYLDYLADGTQERYPHNPLISALLHGGLINLLLVTFILLRSSFIYLGRALTEPFWASTFFITLAFTFISGNTIFSNRFFLLLLLLAFALRCASTRSRATEPRMGIR